MAPNVKRLKTALAELIGFLEQLKSAQWVSILKGINDQLSNPSTVEMGRRQLEDCFGGMGSLNDLYLGEMNGNLPGGHSEKEVNAEFERLMDVVFRENRLASRGLFRRLLWRCYEVRHRGDLAPRIKKTFRAR